jgi:hypothetical protein
MDVVARASSSTRMRRDDDGDIVELAVEHAVAPSFFVICAAVLVGVAAPLALDAILRPNAAAAQVPIVLARVLVLHAAPLGVALLLAVRSGPRLRARSFITPALALAMAAMSLTLVASAAAVFGGAGLLALFGASPFGVSASSIRAAVVPSFLIFAATQAAVSGAAIAIARKSMTSVVAVAVIAGAFTCLAW